MEPVTLLVVSLLIFIVAVLYSSVGHGGASGYLAVLSLFAVAPAIMSSTALILNVLVATISLIAYYRAGHLSLKLAGPFMLLSIPAAFVGGVLDISDRTYFLILALVLLAAAFRLGISLSPSSAEDSNKDVNFVVSLAIGGAIGLLSGVVGVGGGIFLSPMLLLMRWADPKRTSAVSALFIVVNSLAGLGGRFLRGGFQFGGVAPLILAAFLGGIVGSYYGANKLSGMVLRRLLAVVLVLAAIKLIITSF
ncbi:MAG: sulfite exporter TauE/SafE family protein [Ignavibacteriales bacterium]|nr:sulfite exporter TauE/SafE family protein [Ignavibacteriales bacterium]